MGFIRKRVTVKGSTGVRKKTVTIFEGLGFEHLVTYKGVKERMYTDNYCKLILQSLVVA